MIDMSQLPREIKDKLELRSATDPTFFRATEEDYTEVLFETLNSRGQVDSKHSFIASVSGQQGSGKSLGSIAMCKVLDPNFSVDNIFFDYNELVYQRSKLKPGTAVLVDEQSESYGVDSNRVNIILTALKEQLRKKSIHFIFCSPVLKPESASSMYLIETMFLDYEEKECYAAFKTREGLTLGYVRIPHPSLVGVSKEFLDAYEAKKDEHLELLTGNKSADEIEDRANVIINMPLFKSAEKVYIDKMGYMPISMLHQIINKLFPEFKSSIIVSEIASRIKFNKEVSGEWKIPLSGKKKSDF
jgi:hypothetical protein